MSADRDNTAPTSDLARRIEGLASSLECGDGGVRGEFATALAEVDALVAEAERVREAGVRVPMYRFGLSRQSATEMFDRELDALSRDASTGRGADS